MKEDARPPTPMTLTHFINGKNVSDETPHFGTILDPATERVLCSVPYASSQTVSKTVQAAEKAFPDWAATPPSVRAKTLFKFRHLIEQNLDQLAVLISQQHGKSLTESIGSITRGMDVLENTCGIPTLLKGEFSENAGRQIDSYAIRQPLGVCVGITPFNFPAMIPLWMASIAIACGNTFILKPSERDPACGLRLAELAFEAGLPAGVFNVVHGDKETVEALLTHPTVKAISFVGQTATAKFIQKTAVHHGKRVQAFGGAKNHMLIMPDADLDQTVDALIGAAYGSAGERCMAISVGVIVGDDLADLMVEKLIPRVRSLKIGAFTDSKAEMGPLINKEHLDRVKSYVDCGLKEGAKLLVDGREIQRSGSTGYFMGGCLFDKVIPSMKIYQEEIFGPVLCLVRVPDYETGLKLINDHPYGNGTAIFTRDGDCARNFCSRVQVGMVGVNIPIPVPVGYHSFGGWKESFFGDIGMHGMEGVHFFTKLKTITQRWPSGIRSGVDFSLPIHS